MKAIKSTVYESEDGKQFTTEQECRDYEYQAIKRYQDIAYFQVVHNPDLTEGRGYYGLTYIAIEREYKSCAGAVALDWCFALFGRPVGYVQGCAMTESWQLKPSTREKFEAWQDDYIKVGDYPYRAAAIFISARGALGEYPTPQPENPDKRVEK